MVGVHRGRAGVDLFKSGGRSGGTLALHHPSPRTPGTNGWFADGWTGFVAGKSSLAVTDRDPITLNCYGLHPSHFHVCDRVLGRAR